MSAELFQMIGVVLLYIGLVMLGKASSPEETGGGIKPITRDLKPITPATPPPPPSPRTPADEKDPRLEVIRRWQSQGVLNDNGELWWASAAKAKRRNPADDVNPPRIPTKRGRW